MTNAAAPCLTARLPPTMASRTGWFVGGAGETQGAGIRQLPDDQRRQALNPQFAAVTVGSGVPVTLGLGVEDTVGLGEGVAPGAGALRQR